MYLGDKYWMKAVRPSSCVPCFSPSLVKVKGNNQPLINLVPGWILGNLSTKKIRRFLYTCMKHGLPASFQLKLPSIFHSAQTVNVFRLIFDLLDNFGKLILEILPSFWKLMNTNSSMTSVLTSHNPFESLSKSGTLSNSGALVNLPFVS